MSILADDLSMEALVLNRSLVSGCLISLSFLLLAAQSCSANVSYRKAKVAGVWMHIVTANMNSPSVRVTPAVAKNGIGTTETFRSMIRRTRPVAAIDGTFFCTRTFKPTGDIVINGQLINGGYLGTAVAFSEPNIVSFINSKQYCWSDYQSVLSAGPSLLIGGKLAIYPRDQGFRSGVHFLPRIRTGVGITGANKLVLVTTTRKVYLSQLAKAMQALGCVDAAGLDGGSSTGLYFNGKLISNPTRAITNCLLIYDNPESFEQHKKTFFPAQLYSQR